MKGMHGWPTCGTQAFTEGNGFEVAQELREKDVTHGTTSSMHLQSHKKEITKGSAPTLQGSGISKYAQVQPPYATCLKDQIA